jgi:hypothetical protein
MKAAISIIIFLHGLIHILGFVKGFGFLELDELTRPISRSMALLWLSAAVLIIIYSILHFLNYKYAWLFGFIAVLVSQVLIIIFWKDAMLGTLPNLVILIVAIMSFGNYNFQRNVNAEIEDIVGKNNTSNLEIITENDLNQLPKPVKKWLLNSGIVGKPNIHVGKVFQQALIKMKPDQKNWMSANAVQYTTIDNPAFIWTVDVKMNAFLNFKGRDKFMNGKGEMLIKLNSIFNIVNERGEKLNEGTIQRYLGEMVWFPSLAFSKYITWEQLNDTTAKATMNYKGVSGSGTFYYNSAGDFIQFSALRFMGNDDNSKRLDWVLNVEDYSFFEGIKVPSKMTATWKLEDKDWTWLKLTINDIKYNEKVYF